MSLVARSNFQSFRVSCSVVPFAPLLSSGGGSAVVPGVVEASVDGLVVPAGGSLWKPRRTRSIAGADASKMAIDSY
jgi:hypothetical protein